MAFFKKFSRFFGGNQQPAAAAALRPKLPPSQAVIDLSEFLRMHTTVQTTTVQAGVVNLDIQEDDEFIKVSVARKTSAPPTIAPEPVRTPKAMASAPQVVSVPKATAPPAGFGGPLTVQQFVQKPSVARATAPPRPVGGIQRLPGVDYSQDQEKLPPIWETRDSNDEEFNFDAQGLGYVMVSVKDLVAKEKLRKK